MTSAAGRIASSGDGPTRSLSDAIEAAVRAEAGKPGAVPLDLSWSELGLDSFGLISLRAAAEQALGREIGDSDWVAAKSPADLIRLGRSEAAEAPVPARSTFSIEERVEIGMPQMAQGGLSESWLMRTLGDLHWRLIGDALGVRPAAICDGDGHRLVPVFTRIRFVSTRALAAYREGETLCLSASLSRLGSGFFFSRVEVTGDEDRRISADLMSSFAARGSEGSNVDLVRGQARIPEGCGAFILEEMPPFGIGYQERRRAIGEARPVLVRASYDIVPQYDVNGVGMLYCAAYPIIGDICEMRVRGGPAWAAAASTIERDIFYFGNADAGDVLEWRLHEDSAGDGLDTQSSIARGDGTVIAWLVTRKAKQ